MLVNERVAHNLIEFDPVKGCLLNGKPVGAPLVHMVQLLLHFSKNPIGGQVLTGWVTAPSSST